MWIDIGPNCLTGLHSQLRGVMWRCVVYICIFAMFWFYLLVVVGTQATMIHDRYLHNITHILFLFRLMTHLYVVGGQAC